MCGFSGFCVCNYLTLILNFYCLNDPKTIYVKLKHMNTPQHAHILIFLQHSSPCPGWCQRHECSWHPKHCFPFICQVLQILPSHLKFLIWLLLVRTLMQISLLTSCFSNNADLKSSMHKENRASHEYPIKHTSVTHMQIRQTHTATEPMWGSAFSVTGGWHFMSDA